MNSKAHKFCKYLGKTSVKCQDLIKNFKPEYLNTRKRIFLKRHCIAIANKKGLSELAGLDFLKQKKKLNLLLFQSRLLNLKMFLIFMIIQKIIQITAQHYGT